MSRAQAAQWQNFWGGFMQQNNDLQAWEPMLYAYYQGSQNPDAYARLTEAAGTVRGLIAQQAANFSEAKSREEAQRRLAGIPASQMLPGGYYDQPRSQAAQPQESYYDSMNSYVDEMQALQNSRKAKNWKRQEQVTPQQYAQGGRR